MDGPMAKMDPSIDRRIRPAANPQPLVDAGPLGPLIAAGGHRVRNCLPNTGHLQHAQHFSARCHHPILNRGRAALVRIRHGWGLQGMCGLCAA